MLKLEAEDVGDDDFRKKLLAAAKLLADSTAKMVEAAKVIIQHSIQISHH